ncbi:class II aldolase family protein [Microdochium trichocladiopsis]|uniref:Class II aldolase family protein n=1 Tax=Microdochium trichocladiopsis TaxID=1682393 RepID=A0A9P9BPQ0_9PEZI|nr:class II aldolase family protein [Microdochium trichocladiopsis]KAH7024776.1 class II aldolase family protein [Microdochium trichocladiopsis]
MAPAADPIAERSLTTKNATSNELSQKRLQTPLEALSLGPNGLSLPGIPNFPSFAEHRTWIKQHMAGVFRHWSREGYIEGISGHISVQDPEFRDAFWFNPYGVHFGLLKASDMVLVNLDGKIIGGNTEWPVINSAGFLIHTEIHKARPDAAAVVHCHGIYGKAWSVFGRPLEMLTQDTCKFYGDAQAVYDNHGGVVFGPEEGQRIASSLGPNGKGAILRNHGLLTVGRTVDEAAFLLTSMERSCHVQLLADAAAADGVPKKIISDREAKFNFDAESDHDLCYAEFQAYYNYEVKLANGDFLN